MHCLLDSHIIFRAVFESKKLTPWQRELISAPENMLYVSVVSLWELGIKRAIGKLKFPDEFVSQLAERYTLLPLSTADIQAFMKLPIHNRDPFDRMLVAQAQLHNLTMISEDREMHLYSDIIRLNR